MTARQAWLEPDDDVEHLRYLDVHLPGDGPHDVEDLDPEVTLAAGTVDFGAVRVPVPERGTVTVEPADEGRMQAVHVSVPEGRLSVSALAAPRSSRLWPDLVKEIDSSLREGGARVRSFQGDWGRELHATSGAATSRFVGVDGARWMLYGVATGPTRDAVALDEELRRMLRGTVVVRGRSPYPVRTVLPLEVPQHLATAEPAAPEVTVPEQSATTALPVVVPVDPTPPTTAIRVTADAQPPTSTGGRRLREADPPAAEVEPRAGRRRAPEPEPWAGRRRPIDSHASPASGRRRAPDGPNSTVAIPVHDVLRQGRHAATGPASALNRGAVTQPWTAFRPAAAETAPWVGTARDRDPGSITVPLPLIEPAPSVAPDRPTGRHHRAG